MREAVIIFRKAGEVKARHFPSSTEAKEEMKRLREKPPEGATSAEMWTSDSGRSQRVKFRSAVPAVSKEPSDPEAFAKGRIARPEKAEKPTAKKQAQPSKK